MVSKNYLYVGGNEVYAKIGITDNPLQRIKALRSDHGKTFNFVALYRFEYKDIAPAIETLVKHKFGELTEFDSEELFACPCEPIIEWIEGIIGDWLNTHEIHRIY